MKKRISNHLQYFWWAYLAVILVAVLGWSAVFSALARPAYNEKLTVDFFGEGCNILALSQAMGQDVPPLCSQNIREIAVKNPAKTKSATFFQTLQARNYAADIFVFTEDFVGEDYFSSLFVPLDEAWLTERLGEVTFYRQDGKAYGIVLNPTGKENRFTGYYTGDKLCVAAFASESVNLDRMFGKGEAGDDGALVALRYLLQEVS